MIFGNKPPAIRQKWVRELLEHYESWEGFVELEVIQDYHFRLTRTKDGMQMDYFPKTGKAIWLGFEKKIWFVIKDLEQYLLTKFK